MNKKRSLIIIKEDNRILLNIKTLINNKLKRSYIKLFKVFRIRDIIVKLRLLNIKIFFKFYILIIKKVRKDILFIII